MAKSKTTEMLEKFAQAMDALISDRADEQRELMATKAHLEDLRAIIFQFHWVELQRGAPVKLVEEDK